MNTTVFDVLRALTSVAVFVVCMYVVPMIRRTVGESNLAIMEAGQQTRSGTQSST